MERLNGLDGISCAHHRSRIDFILGKEELSGEIISGWETTPGSPFFEGGSGLKPDRLKELSLRKAEMRSRKDRNRKMSK